MTGTDLLYVLYLRPNDVPRTQLGPLDILARCLHPTTRLVRHLRPQNLQSNVPPLNLCLPQVCTCTS